VPGCTSAGLEEVPAAAELSHNRIPKHSFMSKLTATGIYIYAAALAGFGIIELVTSDFLSSALAVPASLPLRGLGVALSIVIFLGGAAAIFFRIRRQLAMVVVGLMYLLFLLTLHLPSLLTHLHSGNDWAVTFEAVMLGGGAFMIAARLPPDTGFGPGWTRFVQSAAVIAHYAFALALFLFATQHILYFDYIVSLIPAWMPAKIVLAYIVIAGYILCGVSFAIGRQIGPAALMLGIMFGLWVIVLHSPRAISKWSVEPEWTSLFVALAVCGIAFFIAGRETAEQPDALIVLPRV